MSLFKNQILLITGGTGSFGNAVLKRFLDTDINEIRIFSRDEKKQDDMRHALQNSKVKFYIGDVRDKRSVDNAMHGVDFIFHAAALKQVPSCEFFPIQAVQTNVLGTENVLDSAIEHGVKNVIVLSTDKAAYPINAMGISKAMMEKVAIAKARSLGEAAVTTICLTRYGNVMASRGSVIPLWIDQLKAGKDITITDPNMTRFMMTLDDAVDLVLYAFEHGKNGDLFVQKAPATTLEVLAKAIYELVGQMSEVESRKAEVLSLKSKVQIPKSNDENKKADKESNASFYKVIGTRHGEKLYETLVTREEMAKAIDMGGYFRIPADNRGLNYDQYFVEGEEKVSMIEDYHSHNTTRLDVEGMKELLKKLEMFKV
jgi:UDP-glucose 4-epimerase